MTLSRINVHELMRESLREGDLDALVGTLVALAADWLAKGGSHWSQRHTIACVRLAEGGPKEVLLASALDLMTVLELTPQGRKAVANLGGKPVAQQAERPGA